ncbi:MAG: murein biosynthesis integral membrane protein MurJ [Epsilonproteobacteria bacterium]|nr:murein biosynthesis integral membrane protein MurJ [Campylobacterota bacterium]|tara:strand:- start:2545 stop:4140 length:1596 start_codon:yes stop_codon:yes gene_type:complete
MSRSILKHTSKIGLLALVSRCIAFLREYLLIRFLSIGDTSDIFFTAFRIPNTMRKIFAEGLLSSILIPAIVNADHKGGASRASRLTTLAFLQIETYILLFCILIFFNAEWTISLIVPGFTADKVIASGKLLQILISFILFISSGAIFAAALQAHKKFFIPAIAPAILNVLYVGALGICWMQNCSIEFFCWSMIAIAIFYFLLHVAAYLYMQFTFEKPTQETWQDFKIVLLQFFPCFLSVGILEINHFVNTAFGSYLTAGSLTLIRTAFQFVNIPVGIIAASLSTVLLPHFSKLHLEEPKELSNHVFEAIKFTLWSTLPICFLLYFFSKEIFQTLFLGDSQAMSKIHMAQSIFIAYLFGLLAFSLNKIFLSIFYALRLSFVPMIATTISIFINYALNRLLIEQYQAAGIAFASSVASILQTIFFLLFLHIHLRLECYWKQYIDFFIKYISQLILMCTIFWILYKSLYLYIETMQFAYSIDIFTIHITTINTQFFLNSIGIWAWAGPLSLLLLLSLYITRKNFGISLAYFDKK